MARLWHLRAPRVNPANGARLVFKAGSRAGEAVRLDRPRLTIGRVADNDLPLADPKVSRHHAVIERRDDGRLTVRDLGSHNGTYVDGLRLSGAHVLTGGDELGVGDERLRVEADERRLAIGRRGALFAAVLLVLVLVFGVGQLVLPGLATSKLRADLSAHGGVRHVDVGATPAVKLLWGHADRVNVLMDSYRSGRGEHTSISDFLDRTRAVGKLDARVGTLHSGLLTLHRVRLHKDGDLLAGSAQLNQQELTASLPTYFHLHVISTSDTGFVLRASATIAGVSTGVRLRITAETGRVVVRPDGIPFGQLATITVFDDPRVFVERVGVRKRGATFLLSARARLK